MFRTLLLLLLSFSFAHAESDSITANIKQTLQTNYGQLIGEVDQVNKSPIAGLFEVVTRDHILYTDETGQYLIDGTLFDMKARRNITEVRTSQLFPVDFSKLPLELAVKKVKGNGKRKMAYFTTPNCNFCTKLERELQNVTDVTLYAFLYPVFDGSAEKVRAVLCSKSPAKAWDNLMLDGVVPAAGKCEVQTDKVLALGKKMKINGTPVMIFANGQSKRGYMPASELDKALDSNN